ncbi:MAG: flagellar basal body rod protein FlgB [Candidatus Thiodiazotropha sp. 6PLUC2]
MIEDIGGVTSRLVSLALDVSSLRQQVTANNIANAETPGFAPQQVSFEQLLEANGMLTSDQPSENSLTRGLESIERQLKHGDLIETNKDELVSLDMEMVNLTENVLHYRALLEGLSKRGSLIKMAISEGR